MRLNWFRNIYVFTTFCISTNLYASIESSQNEILKEIQTVIEKQEAIDHPKEAIQFKSISVLKAEPLPTQEEPIAPQASETSKKSVEISDDSENNLIFDIPVTYNSSVKKWITYFQTTGRNTFRRWLERSSRYLPIIQTELAQAGLPQDLSYLAMIESGFVPHAQSPASAVGIWQFMAPTGNQYGLQTNWWLDERRDYFKSTQAAISYMTDLFKIFKSWYLVAASYNMGEARVKQLVNKYHTHNFWKLAEMGVLSDETKNYVPKAIAAMLIAKAPNLYGFRDIDYHLPISFEYFHVPGGTDLKELAHHLGVSEKHLKELNPELIHAYIPRGVKNHMIRIPKGSMLAVSNYVRQNILGDSRRSARF